MSGSMSKAKKETVVVSFRLPVGIEKEVVKRAKKQNKKRAAYVADVFTLAFVRSLTNEKQTV